MTYYEKYQSCNTLTELKEEAVKDTKVAIFIGNNPDRIQAIEDAMNDVAKEKGWDP